jgi:hypothetical protein
VLLTFAWEVAAMVASCLVRVGSGSDILIGMMVSKEKANMAAPTIQGGCERFPLLAIGDFSCRAKWFLRLNTTIPYGEKSGELTNITNVVPTPFAR